MRTLIRRWLGIGKLDTRVLILELENTHDVLKSLKKRVQELEDETNLYSGSTAKQRGLKEHVWAMTKYLNLRPEETFEIIPSVVEEKTERHFKLVPCSTPEPAVRYKRRKDDWHTER